MNILCIDTSSKLCSVAILDDKKLIKKIELNNGLTHSETLMPNIKAIFDQTNLNIHDINLIICDIGPGSFTGIRIGIATAKAFSDSLNIDLIGINSLECLAHNIHQKAYICSIIDCKNNNCYFALYKFDGQKYIVLNKPEATSIDNLLELLKNNYSSQTIYFVGDGAISYKDKIQNAISNFKFDETASNNLDIYNLGIAGLEKYLHLKHGENVLPLYLKKPQAQRQLESKKFEINKMSINDLNSIDFKDFNTFWNKTILEDELKADNTRYFKVTLDNKIVGFAGIKIVLNEADLMNIVVHNSYLRQGVASLLLNELFIFCKEHNIESINLEVNEKNLPAIDLYKKFGFVEVGRRKKYYDNKDDAILMSMGVNGDGDF